MMLQLSVLRQMMNQEQVPSLVQMDLILQHTNNLDNNGL